MLSIAPLTSGVRLMKRRQALIASVSGIAAALACGCSDTHSGGVGSGTTQHNTLVVDENASGVLRNLGEPEWVGIHPGMLSPDNSRIVTVRLKTPVAADTIYEIQYDAKIAGSSMTSTKGAALFTDETKEPDNPNLSPNEVKVAANSHAFAFIIKTKPTITQDHEVTIGVRRKNYSGPFEKVTVLIDNGNGVFPG